MAKTPATRSSRSTASARSRARSGAKPKASPLPAAAQRALSLLLPLGPVEARHFFGGQGLYLEGRIFAFVMGDSLYIKVDAETKPAFLKAGGEPFVYEGKRGPVEVAYCTPPASALASSAKLLPWAERGLAAARRAAAAKARKAAAKRNGSLGSGEVSRPRQARRGKED